MTQSPSQAHIDFVGFQVVDHLDVGDLFSHLHIVVTPHRYVLGAFHKRYCGLTEQPQSLLAEVFGSVTFACHARVRVEPVEKMAGTQCGKFDIGHPPRGSGSVVSGRKKDFA